jgi:proprotein convertase subtilisin/kexin type 5
MNDNNENQIVEYYIYIPKCENNNFTIINSLNENRYGEERIRIKNLFEVKTNKYYLKLNDKLEDIGYFKLGVTRIESNTYKTLIPNDDTIFDFIVVNKELAKNQLKTIKYIVSVEDEEVYETECTINLSFKSCYHSCETCSVDESQSTAANHNCLKCQTNYYPSPITNTNCYTIDEKNINWYFDSENSKFGICDASCRSCSGPNDNQCLSCESDLYLYNDICMDHCPEGNYPILKQLYGIDYYECEACYDNCLTCSEKGNNENMKCLKCKENYIRYENNCFRVEDPNSLSFYDPFTDSVSSCFQKYSMYIKENTFECIPGIDNGYYIANLETGLLSKCHDNCLTCMTGKKEENGKLISMECLKCKDSDISQKTMIQVEKNCFPIIQYEEEKIAFDIVEMEQEIGIGSCLYFDLAIFSGEYRCITKPENTYYVLNDSRNTGVIKYCHEACKTCDSGNYTDNTNCIECAPGYVKTEYSNTNCLLETSLPSNYFKNNIDNIYYECYPYCKKCDENFDIFNNDMHCSECKSDYFFVYGENNCYKKEEILPSKKYYFSNSDNKFHKCYYTCSECSNNEPSEEVHYCEKCAKAYYFLSETTNCYDINYTENGYYLSNITVMGVTRPKFQKCYQRCKTCFGGLESNSETKEENHNCKECAENYYKLDNGSYPNNCYDNETINAWKKIELSEVNIFMIDSIIF